MRKASFLFVKNVYIFSLRTIECGVCHVSVVGDDVSTRSVPPLWTTTNAEIIGQWMIAEDFRGDDPECGNPNGNCRGGRVTVNVSEGILENYRGPELPLDAVGNPSFPKLDFATVRTLMRGKVSANNLESITITNRHDGNLVLIGTEDSPIVLKVDIFVDGDLVIKGFYKGVGTIYVNGNIYIPADLRATRTAFPFPDNKKDALSHAEALMVASNTDALGLATPGSIFIADLGKQQNFASGTVNQTVYNHPSTPIDRQGEALGVHRIYEWFPRGKEAYDQLYEYAYGCLTQQQTQIGSFNMIEAFMYAGNTIAGISRRASYTLRGGIMSDYFHVVSGAAYCEPDPSPVHGRPTNRSYIEYDYRLQTGKLRILEHLGAKFPAPK